MMKKDVNSICAYNHAAWNKAVERKSQWTIAVTPETIMAARKGDWQIVLTPTKSVPRHWFPDLNGRLVLCLASGGGQQGPILAAAGANVTVYDNSSRQLAQDWLVAKRDGLVVQTIEGDMSDLSMFEDEAFELIVHPCSNLFVPDVRPVWQEAFRVLSEGGTMMAGFCNPVAYIFDQKLADDGILKVRHSLPYSDLESITEDERRRYMDDLQPLEFGHTLDDQIGGQIDAGFSIIGFYEDSWPGTALADYMPTFMATLAQKG